MSASSDFSLSHSLRLRSLNLHSTARHCLSLIVLLALLPGGARAATVLQELEVVVITSSLSSRARVARLEKEATLRGVSVRAVAASATDEGALTPVVAGADLILVDLPHSSVIETTVASCGASLIASSSPVVCLRASEAEPALSADSVAGVLPAQRGLGLGAARKLSAYWSNGGKHNRTAFLDAIVALAAGGPWDESALPEPVLLPKAGFYHPEWTSPATDLPSMIAERFPADRPVAAIAIHRLTISSDDTAWINAVISALEERGISAYAFFGSGRNPNLFAEMTCLDGAAATQPAVDLIINATLVFRSQQRKAELERIGIPTLQTLPALSMTEAEWRASADGLALSDISFYLSSSELAGMVDPVLVTARDNATGSLAPIMDQCEALADKAAGVVRLRRTARADRRLAIFVYNYPGGLSNFGASFLNVPRSLESVLTGLLAAGFGVERATEDEIIAGVQAALSADEETEANDTAWLPTADYRAWFESLPAGTQSRITEYWGPPEPSDATAGNIEQGFRIPHMRLGNAILLPQPSRFELGRTVDGELRKERIGHRSAVPLSHRYLATYLWIRETFGAHALVHFGTHGSVEWAPGKQRGLSRDDDPWLALGAVPNVYPYIMDNLGEAITAKRRGRGLMISHLTPMFTPAGFRPGLHAMHDLMHDWETIDEGVIRDEVEKQLIDAFVEHALDKDLGVTPEEIAADFEGFMESLHPYLDDIAQTAQPQGLAVFGEIPNETRRLGMIMQMLRKPLIDGLGEDIDEVFLLDATKVPDSRPARWLRLALEDAEAASTLDLRRIDKLSSGDPSSVPNRAEDKRLDPAVLLGLAERAQALHQSLSTNGEIDSLIAALDGQHLPASYGGDPVRNPESLPTGRNLYGFDPARVPTRQAFEVGCRVFDQWLEQYRAEHGGENPDTVAFSLWAGETMRHQGILESEALYALGVRPVWDDGGRVIGTERISRAELGRPRVDVVLSVTGSYRDQFPRVMAWMDEAIEELASDASDGNAIAAAAEAQMKRLVEGGETEERARSLANRRIFSNEPGMYGTGLNHAVDASELWQDQSRGGGDEEMASLFVDRMGHVFGGGLEGAAAPGLFSAALGRVDAVLTSRSSHTYGVLTSDDPFAYIGGLSLAARLSSTNEDGTPPDMYFQNMRDASEVINDPAARAIAKELQTRYLHPQWIESQQAEGYAGTLQVLKATQFLWGWQAIAPETIREDQWQSIFDVYVEDQYDLGTVEWLSAKNQGAWAETLGRMLDAVRLDYWTPSEATTQRLTEAYQQATSGAMTADLHAGVEAFVEANLVAAASMPGEPVQGQELVPVPQEEPAAPENPQDEPAPLNVRLLGGIALGAAVLFGLIRRSRALRSQSKAT